MMSLSQPRDKSTFFHSVFLSELSHHHSPSSVTFYSSPVMETLSESCPHPSHSHTNMPPLVPSSVPIFEHVKVDANLTENLNSDRF